MAPNVTLSFGPMLIGTFFNMILYGVLIVQCYHYYLHFKRDARWIKGLVLYLFIIETVNTGFDMQMMFQPLIQRFGQPDATKYFPTVFAAEPIAIVLVSTPIQFFFAWRVLLLTKSRWLAGLICLFALVSLGGGLWTAALIIKIKEFARKVELHWTALVWFLAACIADILITVVLVVTLNKKRTGFAATDDAIQKIIRMTVPTGALTALFAVGDVVFFMTMGHTGLNFIWDLALTKLYANCLLSTLNSRSTHLDSTIPSYSGSGQGAPGRVFAGSMVARRGISGVHDSFGFPTRHNGRSSEYELDVTNRRSIGPIGEKPMNELPPYPQRDLEFGITVTKVVETLGDEDHDVRNVNKSSHDSSSKSTFTHETAVAQ